MIFNLNYMEDNAMTKEEKAARFQKLNQNIQKGQILCAGSSLMEMFPVEKFIKEEYPGTIIYNRGIGGYITDELLEHLDVCVLDLQPSRLFINIGTNDLSNPDVTIDGLMKKYDEILCRIEEAIPGIEILMMFSTTASTNSGFIWSPTDHSGECWVERTIVSAATGLPST